MMKVNKWTLGLAAVGLVTIPTIAQAEEKPLSSLQTLVSSTTISGYVDTSAQWNIGNQNHYIGGLPPAYAFNGPSKQDGFNLNVVNVAIEKPLSAEETWAAGYKIEMLYGPNAVGYNPSFVGDSTSDFGLKQAYVALRAPVGGNGLDFKIGTFDSIIGYEVYHSGNNPNYTRSWAYSAEPTQHTGLLMSYQVCKEFGIAGGIANTANAGINNRSFLTSSKSETDKTYMGAITISAPESMGFLAGSTLYGAIVNGFNTGSPTAPNLSSLTSSYYADGVTYMYAGMVLNTPLKGFQLGFAYDYIGGHGSTAGYQYYPALSTGALPVGNTWFDAISGYAIYKATDKLSLSARAEYMWTDSPLYQIPGSGLADKIFSVTGTIRYDLWANVISRVEFRWDHCADGSYNFNDQDRNAYMVAANIIYQF